MNAFLKNKVIWIIAGLLIVPSVHLEAQWVEKWITIGEMQNKYTNAGGIPEAIRPFLHWPAIIPQSYYGRSKALWITATDWTSEDDDTYPVKISSVGPRELGVNHVFPQRFQLISRIEKPLVTVDGFETFQRAVTIDTVDPNIPSDMMIDNVINTTTGITVRRRILAFSQDHHDNYHINEYVLTNTGNVDDDPDIELDQTMEGVWLYSTIRHETAYWGFGNLDMNDVVIGDPAHDQIDDYDIDFRAWFTWGGFIDNWYGIHEIGHPQISSANAKSVPTDTTGRLASPGFTGVVALHVDQSATDETNDPDQPATMGWRWDAEGTQRDPFNKDQMSEGFTKYVTQGIMEPHHADIIAPDPAGYNSWIERMADQTADPGRGRNGISATYAIGPFTLAPGEDVRIVMAEGIDGLDLKAAFEIGGQYKESGAFGERGSGGNKGPDIEYNGVAMTKNEWVLTGRDSLFDTFKRARANLQSGYSIPLAPDPPSEFHVQSLPDEILLEWEANEDPPGGFEIYRGQNQYQGEVAKSFQYDLIASPGPGERSYSDSDVSRGVGYYYYIQAVGDVNNDNTGLTPTGKPLKSNRFYTQTYDPAQLKRAPGDALEAIRIVPNPFNLSADQNVRWPDFQDKMGFLEIPGNCTIRIYTETGELVETIEHTDGSGDEYWDLTTYSNQVVVSGVYFLHVENNETGENIIKKFAIIR